MSPTALFISGDPASGKSTLAGAVARRLGAALLDLDVVTGSLTRLLGEITGINAAPDNPWMREHARTARYEALLDTALDTLRIGTPAVLVAPFTTERADPHVWAETAARVRAIGANPILVWVDCPPELVLARMRERAAARDASKLALPERVLSAPRVPPKSPHVRVDARRSIVEQLDELGLCGRSGRNRTCGEATSRSTTWPPQPG
jgi:predicted kinase